MKKFQIKTIDKLIKYLNQKKRELQCEHNNQFSYYFDNGLCREPYYWCPDCKKGIRPKGEEYKPGEWYLHYNHKPIKCPEYLK